jgi:hypothetical protein
MIVNFAIETSEAYFGQLTRAPRIHYIFSLAIGRFLERAHDSQTQ